MGTAGRFLRGALQITTLFVLAMCGLLPSAGAQSPVRHTRKKSSFVAVPSSPAPILTFTPGMAGTVASTGVGGYAGDGGPAASAQFNFPTGMARDAQSNLYVADSANSVVRKFSVGGNISTVAGTGTQGYSGDGGPATQAQLAFPTAVAVDNAGNLYIAGKSQSHPSRAKPSPAVPISDSPCAATSPTHPARRSPRRA